MEAIEKEKDMPIVSGSIEELHELKVADVACGLDQSLVLCCNGTLFSGESNAYGQFGRVNKDLGRRPVDIHFQPLSIASGIGHSLAVCKAPSSEATGDATSVVSWGWNQSSQLGRKVQRKILRLLNTCSVSGIGHIPLLSQLRKRFGLGAAGRMGGSGWAALLMKWNLCWLNIWKVLKLFKLLQG